ncbi:protein of unknown function [Vibrio tapetis subsp. tapetis]|uniref:Uncharacterized protein n=1 Tax=Vibrio tapetis subsp. tapetis TaxID=1671868 RepID=A0A2N8ZN04_9VIBR|nr:protein of unknown function [Vibrio tapetis subsp. tapetis]
MAFFVIDISKSFITNRVDNESYWTTMKHSNKNISLIFDLHRAQF